MSERRNVPRAKEAKSASGRKEKRSCATKNVCDFVSIWPWQKLANKYIQKGAAAPERNCQLYSSIALEFED